VLVCVTLLKTRVMVLYIAREELTVICYTDVLVFDKLMDV
jgi:hypothetical protein